MDHIYGLSQKCLDFSKIMSGTLDPRIPTFWNSVPCGASVPGTELSTGITPAASFQAQVEEL